MSQCWIMPWIILSQSRFNRLSEWWDSIKWINYDPTSMPHKSGSCPHLGVLISKLWFRQLMKTCSLGRRAQASTGTSWRNWLTFRICLSSMESLASTKRMSCIVCNTEKLHRQIGSLNLSTSKRVRHLLWSSTWMVGIRTLKSHINTSLSWSSTRGCSRTTHRYNINNRPLQPIGNRLTISLSSLTPTKGITAH